MEIAMVGLGKMGANMSKRLLQGGHRVVVADLNAEAVATAVAAGAIAADSLESLPRLLAAPRAVWMMVPAGDATQNVINTLARVLRPGDIIVDGGNSNYKDSMRRAAVLREIGLHFVDVGTSGGIWGLSEGYSLMVGGSEEAVAHLRPALETLAPGAEIGWGHVGPSGAGHFVKMIHNGIEYGLMQAYAEGFELMNHKEELGLDLHQIAEIWRHGSVVRSWLLDLTADALADNPTLAGIAAYVPDSGEGRWTVAEAIELNCAIPVITMALQRRFRSREEAPFADKLLAAMRNQFGGHAVKKAD
ncbi:MAG: decarboxylating 6-phosphogluconate dehydrogenase [Chloroflexi bacterium]|nr:decarboxylating 6-phosphogluconate dehydrogenase [Ardenticatenaceae bacterium]MBL1129417.1 decarboxylating 6-phosphogluconate dehydrogenase [Chloroflexota bacterium]NOG35497.1 decarboxylating 6-phosphogluconate dehydrogenase [Chloroflexota bacterium]GIK57446.1 MAG: 6-phosphogluconate dehydrogenase [Chloroflexota bacterium]